MASPIAPVEAKDGHAIEPRASAAEYIEPKSDTVAADRQAEHDLTMKQVFARHPALAFWSFYWAMAGVGW